MNVFKTCFLCLFLAAPLMGIGGCTTNAATGKSNFTAFMSPEKEKEVGAKEHPKIIEQFGGVYDAPELGFYVARIGAKLAVYSELPDMEYTFTILNDEKVNAFAVPGGYVYITRGLLAIAMDEAEMAGVLAHEIGHLTARHTAQRYSATMATNIGLQVLGVLGSVAGAPTGTGQLVSYGAQAALQSYSREQELESDQLGVRYLSRAGYDPDAMTGFFHKLQAHSKLEAAMRGEKNRSESFNIMSTHPLTSERITEAERLATETSIKGRERGEATYAKEIDGLIFGDDPEQGIRRGRVFEHPGLGIRFEVPPGFSMINSPTSVIAKDTDGAAVIFDMAPAKKVRQLGGISKYLAAINIKGVKFKKIESLEINAMDAVTGIARVGEEDVRLLVIKESKEQIFQLLFRSKLKRTEELALDFRRTTYSFKRLSAEEIAAIQPLRIRFETVQKGESAGEIAARMPMEKFNLQWFELLNNINPEEPLVPGSLVRVIAE
ncbi:MAG: M48 family metalloprotease [Rhodospirillales bacterium]|nr:M48 family metalloprotease [Rhodospirillales bacterium]